MAIPATVRDYLQSHGADYDIFPHPYAETSNRAAAAAHVTGERVAKGVLLKDADGFVLAVVPATHTVQVERVRDLLDRALETAPESDLKGVFPDCALGAVPALGPAYDLATICDESLQDLPEVYFEAGDHEELIRVNGETFNALLEGAQSLQFSAHRA